MINSIILTKNDLKRKNFKPDDFFYSPSASKLKINNTTDNVGILACLMLVADKIQEVRDLLNKPIKITSAYRCLELNRALGSKDSSQHIQGQAIDFQCPEFGSPEQIVNFMKANNVIVDQCLIERSGSRHWVHLSITHNKNRNQYARLIDGKFTI